MPRNLSTKLSSALPPERLDLLRRIAALAAEQNLPLYLVGGFVRDLLLNRPSTDLDLVLEGNAIHLARRVVSALGGDLTTHDKFLTATWTLPDESQSTVASLDFITARRETYAHPAALPDVTASTIDDDLRRRDFTLNTLALRLDGDHFGELYDPLHGEQDLQAGLIRVLHPNSFIDDPSRIFRAVRYEQRYGFHIEPENEALVERDKTHISALSGDRIRHELELCAQESEVGFVIERLDGLDILIEIHPALKFDFHSWLFALHIQGDLDSFVQALWASWMSEFTLQTLDEILRRLNFPTDQAELFRQINQARAIYQNYTPATPISEIHKQVRQFTIKALRATSGLFQDQSLETHFHDYCFRRENMHLVTNGHDIEALGLLPGPKYKDILFRLECAYLDGEINTPDEERALLRQLVEQATSN